MYKADRHRSVGRTTPSSYTQNLVLHQTVGCRECGIVLSNGCLGMEGRLILSDDGWSHCFWPSVVRGRGWNHNHPIGRGRDKPLVIPDSGKDTRRRLYGFPSLILETVGLKFSYDRVLHFPSDIRRGLHLWRTKEMTAIIDYRNRLLCNSFKKVLPKHCNLYIVDLYCLKTNKESNVGV